MKEYQLKDFLQAAYELGQLDNLSDEYELSSLSEELVLDCLAMKLLATMDKKTELERIAELEEKLKASNNTVAVYSDRIKYLENAVLMYDQHFLD